MNAEPKRAREETAQARVDRMPTIVTGDDYVDSLRGRDVTVYLFGKRCRNRSIIR